MMSGSSTNIGKIPERLVENIIMDVKPTKETWLEQCIRNSRFFQAGSQPPHWELGDCFQGFECEVPHDTIPDGTQWLPFEKHLQTPKYRRYKLVAKEKDTSAAAEHSDKECKSQ